MMKQYQPMDRVQTQQLARADLVLWAVQWLRAPSEVNRPEPMHDQHRATLLDATGFGETDDLAHAIQQLELHRASTSLVAWQDEYHRLFETGGTCPIEEAAYVRRDKGAVLGDVCGFYRAFGFEPDRGGDRPDHLAAEFEFAAVLLVMGVQAGHVDNHEAQRVTRDALHAFAQDHLDCYLGAFVNHLRRTTVLPLYEALSDVVEGVWERLVDAEGISRCETAAAEVAVSEPEEISACGLAATAPEDRAVELRVSAQGGRS